MDSLLPLVSFLSLLFSCMFIFLFFLCKAVYGKQEIWETSL